MNFCCPICRSTTYKTDSSSAQTEIPAMWFQGLSMTANFMCCGCSTRFGNPAQFTLAQKPNTHSDED